MTQKITPFIRATNSAKEMAEFYTNIFPDAKIVSESHFVTEFEIFGSKLATLNGWEYPWAKLNPSISFSLWITDKDLTKSIWDKLSDGWSVMMDFDNYSRSEGYGRCNDKYWTSRQVMYDNRPDRNNELVPSLMFIQNNNGKTQEAIDYYTSLFANSNIDFVRKYAAGENDIEWNIAHTEFKLDGQQFIAMDSSADHKFNFNDWISLSISCDWQEEVDYFRNHFVNDWWAESMCGRCKDKYWVSRQVVPVQLMQAFADPINWQKAMQNMMKMKKIVIADL